MAQNGNAAGGAGEAVSLIRKAMVDKRWAEALALIGKVGPQARTPELTLWKARALYHAGEHEAARSAYEAILGADGYNREAMITLARLAYRDQDWARVKSLMQRLLNSAPDDAEAHLMLARTASNEQQDSVAIAHFEAVRSQRPDDPDILKSLGRLYYRSDATDAALSIFERLATVLPNDLETNLLLARSAAKANADGPAAAALERLIAADPTHVEGRVLLGRLLTKQRDDDRAIRLWEGLSTDPSCAREAHVQLARIHARAEAWKKVEKHARAALKVDPAHAEMRRLLAGVAGKLGHAGEALELWAELSASNPADVQAVVETARAMSAQGDVAGARERIHPVCAATGNLTALVELARLDLLLGESKPPKSAEALLAAEPDKVRLVTAMLDGGLAPVSQLGKAFDEVELAGGFADQGQWRLAARLLEAAPEAQKADPRLWARVLTGLGRNDEADKAWTAILKKQPKDAEALGARAGIALRAGDAAEAVTLADEWAHADPTAVEALILKARALGRAGKTQECVEAWQAARKQAPKSVEAWSGEAQAAWNAGDRAAAAKAAASALKLDPDHLDALVIAARCEHAADGPEADNLWRRAAAVAPAKLEPHLQLARLMRKAEKVDEAVAAYRRVLAIDPAHGEALAHLGRMLRQHGRRDEEVEVWEAWIAHYPEAVEPRLYLARIRANARDVPGAIELYRSILKIEPANAQVLSELSALVAKTVA